MQNPLPLKALALTLVLATALSSCATKLPPPQVIERETTSRPVPTGLTLPCQPLAPLLIPENKWQLMTVNEQLAVLTANDTERNKQYATCMGRHNDLVRLDIVLREGQQ